MRVFVGIALDPPVHDAILRYKESLEPLAPTVRWVRPESLHITLKFIGEIPPEQLSNLVGALRQVRSEPFDIALRDVGFFPTPRSPRVFWVGVHAGERLARLAAAVDRAVVDLPQLKIAPETNPYRPHITLARSGSGRPQPKRGDHPSLGLRALAEKLPQKAVPNFGTMTAREFILYESKLSPAGARYTGLERFPLE